MAPGDCCQPPPPSEYKAKGTEEKWEDYHVYVTGSLDKTDKAVLYLSDIYGWRVPQARQLADKIAAAGYYVVIPDFLSDTPYEPADPADEFGVLPNFLQQNNVPKVRKVAIHAMATLQLRGASRVGITAFCYGAKTGVTLLRNELGVGGAVFCHPSFMTMEEIKAVEVPLSILGAEIDNVTPPDEALKFGAALAASPLLGNKSFVKIFEGADHGWTTRYDAKDEAAVKRVEEAYCYIVKWFNTYL